MNRGGKDIFFSGHILKAFVPIHLLQIGYKHVLHAVAGLARMSICKMDVTTCILVLMPANSETLAKLNPAAIKNVTEPDRGSLVFQSSMDTSSTSVLIAKTEGRMWPIHLGNVLKYRITKIVLLSANQAAHSIQKVR